MHEIDKPIEIKNDKHAVELMRKAMEAHNLNQAQIACLMRTHIPVISNFLSMKTKPSRNFMLRVDAVFNVGFKKSLENFIRNYEASGEGIFPANHHKNAARTVKSRQPLLFQKYEFLSARSKKAINHHIEMAFTAESQ